MVKNTKKMKAKKEQPVEEVTQGTTEEQPEQDGLQTQTDQTEKQTRKRKRSEESKCSVFA
jgi:hypothetical protein